MGTAAPQDGIDWTATVVLWRFGWAAAALAIVFMGAIFFDRFDPSQSNWRSRTKPTKRSSPTPAAETGEVFSAKLVSQPSPVHLTSLDQRFGNPSLVRICVAELRLSLKGCRWWWYAVAAGLLIGQFASAIDVSRGLLLTVAWIWPILIWSALGTREKRFGTEQFLFSCSQILFRQLPAAWLAGVIITVFIGAGTGFRLAIAGRKADLFAWAMGALFVPSLALALGVWSGTSRFFEGLYTALWYIGPLNRVSGIDFTGAGSGALAGRFAILYLVISAALVLTAFLGRARQLRGT